MGEHICEWCERPATGVEAITVPSKNGLGEPIRRETGYKLRHCDAHKNIAMLHAAQFTPSSEGSLADDLEAAP